MKRSVGEQLPRQKNANSDYINNSSKQAKTAWDITKINRPSSNNLFADKI